MLISYKWLKKYLPGLDAISKQEIAAALTKKLAEVEEIRPVRAELSEVYCGEVLSVEKLENSDKLSLCEVTIKEGATRKVVCGAPNVTKGIKVAVVIPGGTVYDSHSTDPKATLSVESRAVRGVTSEGMICSERELGISSEHGGIMILENELPIGTDIAEILRDSIFEIENKSISHRPDCFSHEGIAREISAIFDLEMANNQDERPIIPTKTLELETQVKVTPENCARFMSICLADLEVSASPLWLKALLTAVGTRSINNVVDAANYIMFDKGQPLHTYDYDKVDSKKLVVRFARADEKITALDGKEYNLDDTILVIANGSKVDDIAGIMGGANSEINSETKNIIIEAANFNMYSVRRTSRKLGLRTEASTRFEKGQDPELAAEGLKAAVQLISDLTHCEIASEIQDIYPEPREIRQIDIELNKIKRFLGIELTIKQVVDYLERLQLKVIDPEKIPNINLTPDLDQIISVEIPTFRSDLKIEADIMEEIIRSYGYERIEPSLPTKTITATIQNKGARLQRAVVTSLTGSGLDEVYTYSFVGQQLYEKLLLKISDCLAIENPVSPELSHLRHLLLPNLLEKIELNAKNHDSFGYFETGRVIRKELDETGIHFQPMHVAGLTFTTDNNSIEFFKVKGVINALAEDLGINFSFEKISETHQFPGYMLLHKGRSAALIWDGELVGFCGELHPEITDNLGLKGRVGVFEFDASKLAQKVTYAKEYKALSIYQAVNRDLSFWLNAGVSFGDVEAVIKGLNEPLISHINVKDVFRKDQEALKKSMTISLVLQSDLKTLSENDITSTIEKVIKALGQELQAEMRTGE